MPMEDEKINGLGYLQMPTEALLVITYREDEEGDGYTWTLTRPNGAKQVSEEFETFQEAFDDFQKTFFEVGFDKVRANIVLF